jgi:N-acetyldiaminopimelate deacetylase
VLDLIEIRRELHRIPEPGFQESETSDKLNEIITGLTRDRDDVTVDREDTAIVVHVRGSGGKTIGWRADIDGVPTAERTGLPFASRHPGLMHACGHDVHMTCGLGILERILSQPQTNDFVFLFQPAEEGGGGAKAVYEAGLLTRYGIDEIYALHVSPQWDAGVIAARPGTVFASASEMVVEFTGVPGHAGMPHEAVDPIVAVADFVTQIQSIVGRSFEPAAGGVALSLHTIAGGAATNGIAPSARVAGTLRVMNKGQRELAYKRIREIANGISLSTGAAVDVRLDEGADQPVVDDEAITRRFTEFVSARSDVRFAEAPVTMASDDYGYLVSHIPGMIFWLGVGGDNPLHSDKFAPDESAIEPTVAVVGDYLIQL